jgi:hypothetical protein
MKLSGLVLISFLLSGCTTYTVVGLDDHPTKRLTKIETIKTVGFLSLVLSSKRQYWLCRDKKKSVDCALQCDNGEGSLICPSSKEFK